MTPLGTVVAPGERPLFLWYLCVSEEGDSQPVQLPEPQLTTHLPHSNRRTLIPGLILPSGGQTPPQQPKIPALLRSQNPKVQDLGFPGVHFTEEDTGSPAQQTTVVGNGNLQSSGLCSSQSIECLEQESVWIFCAVTDCPVPLCNTY